MASNLKQGGIMPSETSPKWIWLLLAVLFAIFILFWGIHRWGSSLIEEKIKRFPFYQVTNRDFSLFLWQNPSFMRKTGDFRLGHLPHFSSDDDIRVMPKFADKTVSASSEVIYRYHVWNRLLGDSLAPRPILGKEFSYFLEENCEYQPQHWTGAPKQYAEMVKDLDSFQNQNLQNLPRDVFPLKARMAFQGWKNYYFEWDSIQSIRPTLEEVNQFLKLHPHYSRPYWFNLLKEEVPLYLISFPKGAQENLDDPDKPVPDAELSSFLKIALFNYSTATNPSGKTGPALPMTSFPLKKSR